MTNKQLEIARKCIYACETGGQVYGNARYDCYVGNHTNSDKEKIYYKIVQVINSKVKYTYKDNDSLYHFYRYSDWSKYSDEKYNSDEMTEVKEATVYRYKKT